VHLLDPNSLFKVSWFAHPQGGGMNTGTPFFRHAEERCPGETVLPARRRSNAARAIPRRGTNGDRTGRATGIFGPLFDILIGHSDEALVLQPHQPCESNGGSRQTMRPRKGKR